MKRLKELRQAKGVYQKEIAEYLGISRPAYTQYESERRVPDADTLVRIAEYFGVTVDYLLGRKVTESKPDMFKLPTLREVPLVGTIACGDPITAAENVERYVSVLDSIDVDFALTCKGDSMIGARIHDGDVVFIKQQNQVDNGTIAAVLIGEEATLKRVYYYPDKNMVILKAENTSFPDLVYAGTELEQIRILGKAVSFTSLVR